MNSQCLGMVAFVDSLHKNNWPFIFLLGAAIQLATNDSDVYVPVMSGTELGDFLKNPSSNDYTARSGPALAGS